MQGGRRLAAGHNHEHKVSGLPAHRLRRRVSCSRSHDDVPSLRSYRDACGGRIVPYEIRLKCGDFVYAPCDNDLFVRKRLRFRVGDRVECLCGDDDDDGDGDGDGDGVWRLGTVIATEYEEDDANFFRVMPYRIQLDAGDVVLADNDDDDLVRRSTAPRVCRGELNGFVHVTSKMLIYNEEYEAAAEMLLERINKIRSKMQKDVLDNEESMAAMRVDLANFLLHLAETYQGMGSLKEMKDTLDVSAVSYSQWNVFYYFCIQRK